MCDYEGYFFDLDGTVYLGGRLLPGVAESLAYLRKADKRILYLSNTTTRTRQECGLWLRELGVEALEDEVVTAGYASALYLRESRSSAVYVIGGQALVQELRLQGVGITSDALEASHVLVGLDTRFDYHKLHQSMRALRNGAALIAANPDPNCPVDQDLLPDTWSMVRAIETASSMNHQTIIGKPSLYYGSVALAQCRLPGSRCLMIGDRLETDVRFGQANGLRTALVLTGVTTREELEASELNPDYVWSTMEQFLAMVQAR